MFRRIASTIVVAGLFASGCGDDPETSRQLAAAGAVGAVSGDISAENPVVFGSFETAGTDYKLEQDGRTTIGCCRRVSVTASQPVFGSDPSNLVSIKSALGLSADSLISGVDAERVRFLIPRIYMPLDRSAVTLSVTVSESDDPNSRPDTQDTTATLRLGDDVVVLPVWVHIFDFDSGPGTLPDEAIRAMFDSPFVLSRLNTVQPATGTTSGFTGILTDAAEAGTRSGRSSVDEIWSQANINFRLMDINRIVDRELAAEFIDDEGLTARQVTNALKRVTNDYHRNFVDTVGDGVHIYIGGRLGDDVTAGTALSEPSRCGTGPDTSSPDDRMFIARTTASGNYEAVIAHELGHMLGLTHPDENTSPRCGSDLVPDDERSSNLMTGASGGGDRLTSSQIERSREIACLRNETYNLQNPACA